jgi:serine phosphatase RsbU (regulator of sigma subunit)
LKKDKDVTFLFVDDEPEILSSLQRFLRKEPYRTHFAESGREALDILSKHPVDIIVSDLRMPEIDGLTLLKQVKSDYPEVLRIILSATRDMDQTIEAINTGEVYRFVSKPLDPHVFRRILQDTVDYHLLIAGRKETIAEIERRLLQSRPPKNLEGADIAALMIPSGELDGDFADYFVYNSRQMDILVGDVMGKGIQSALLAAGIKQQFAKSLAVVDCRINPRISCPHIINAGEQFSSVLSAVQAECTDDLLDLEMFCTLVFARLDLVAGKLHLFDLGHCPVIHYHAETGKCSLLKSGNMPLGFVKNETYQVMTNDLKEGDMLLFHTDGVTETRSSSGEMYGIERLAEKVRSSHHLTAAQLLDAIVGSVCSFSGHCSFDDDFTCIAVRIESLPAKGEH